MCVETRGITCAFILSTIKGSPVARAIDLQHGKFRASFSGLLRARKER